MLFFEGAEKKAEITVSKKLSLLNDIDDSFWRALVERCDAKILSQISNGYCKAFVLSESSLLVWESKFIILTCGVTRLVNGIEFFIKEFGQKVIEHVVYQRNNEYYSHAQPSCFGDDISFLSQYIKGYALRFGEMDSHHSFLFQLESQYKSKLTEQNYQFSAYQIDDQITEQLTREDLSLEAVRKILNLEDVLAGFTIDDHLFEPYGYSLNAIKDDSYLTIHITPQKNSSYVSVEANINLIAITPHLLALFQPVSFDLLTSNVFDFISLTTNYLPSQYISASLIEETLKNGSIVNFAHYFLPQEKMKSAVVIDLLVENKAL